MIEILIVISIVGFFGLFNEAIGTPFEKYDPKAPFSFYTDWYAKFINIAQISTPQEIALKGNENREQTAIINHTNMIYRLEHAKQFINSSKWIICGYCFSTRIALTLIPVWIYFYGPKGILYTGLHLFLNLFLHAKTKYE